MKSFRKFILLTLILTCQQAIAATDESVKLPKSPIYVEYDDLSYDQEKDITIFKGNVIIVQDKEMLTADEIHYYKKEGKYYAKGNVAILKEDGSVYFADIINLDKVFHKGRAINFKARLLQNGLLAASSVEIYSKNRMGLNNVVYSTCKVCENNLVPFIPLWQIKAREALINRNKETIKYKHARVEALGIPIIYTPYLTTPAPGAKRKSGFLFPNFKWSEEFGNTIKLPYYWNIAPNMDATIIPRFNTRKDHALEGEFRHLIPLGEYEVKASITHTNKVQKDGTEIPDKKKPRGHLDIKALFQYNYAQYATFLGLESRRVYDKSKTYLKKYKFSDDDVLTTDVFLKSFWDNNYIFLDTIYFQGLRPNDNWKTTPRIIPWLRGYYVKNLEYNNSQLSVDTDVLNLYRNQGVGYNRFSTTAKYRVPFILPYGQLFTFNPSVRGDFYHLNQRAISKNQVIQFTNNGQEGSTARAYPELNLEWSLPFINYTRIGTFVLEPVVDAIITTDKVPSDILTNEDSQFFELSALNLFSNNRYLGLDQLETGSRLNYGLRGNYRSKYIQNLGFTFGEVINIKKHDKYMNTSGLNSKRSDFVSKIYFQPVHEVYIAHKLRLEEEDLAIMRNEVHAEFSFRKWNLGMNYMEVGKRMLDPTKDLYRKDITGFVAYNFYDKWWIRTATKRKLGDKIPGQSKKITEGVNLNYIGDCLHVFFTVERDHTQLNDLRPSTTYSLNFQIPTF